jgi:hypothetical protein
LTHFFSITHQASSPQVIYLDSEDDIISICDRLDWTADQRVLLALPEDGGALREGLDLVRLRRHADRLRREVGLVTADTDIIRQARALGFPTFLTVEAGQNGRRGWWRGRRRRERVGLPTLGGSSLAALRPATLDEEDRREAARRLAPRPTWRRWLLRYAAILLFFTTLALLVVGFTYAVPGATIILKPEVRPVQAVRQVTADPSLDEVDYDRNALPGRLLSITETWRTDVATTGTVEVPKAPARGRVVFVNKLAQEVTVPAGTRVSTSEGNNIVYQTLNAVTVPDVVGSTAETDVIAIEPGPQGNVEANLVNRIEGSLSVQLEVRNLEPITGGAMRMEAAVTEADRTRLRSQVLQFLQAVALARMEAQLTEREFLALESLRVATILSETYSHFPGEQANRLALEIRAEVQGTAVDTTAAAGFAYQSLSADLPAGFTLAPASIRFTTGDVVAVDEQGRVTLELVSEGVAAADLDLAQPIEAITGQAPDVALAYLYERLPLRDVPTARVWPTWFGRIPYLPARIQVEVQTEG